MREAESGLGGVDMLVHSAGGSAYGTIDECSPELWKSCFDVHVHAAYLPVPPRACRRCARRAKERSF